MPKKSQNCQNGFSLCPCVGATLDRLVQPAILAILSKESLHGYELVQKIGSMPHFFKELPDMSGVYRVLKLLETRGLVTSNWDISNGGRPKRVFAITELGWQCLEHWNNTLRNYHKTIGSLLKATQKAVEVRSPNKIQK